MNNDATPLHRLIDLRLLALWPIVALVHVVGNLTGHYRGLQAQTEIGLYAQGVMIVLLLAALLVFVPAVRRQAEQS